MKKLTVIELAKLTPAERVEYVNARKAFKRSQKSHHVTVTHGLAGVGGEHVSG